MKTNLKKTKPVKKKTNRLKRMLKNIDWGFALLLSLGIGFMIGAILGFIYIILTPMTWLDTVFSRFLDVILCSLAGGMAGAGIVLIIEIFIGCFLGIRNFISDLRG